MKEYQRLLTDIINKGTNKLPSRKNLPYTISLFGTRIEHDIRDGFPLLTTKKMAWKSIVHELLWFLRGETNIKYLIDNNVHIWDQDAYRWYLKFVSIMVEPDYDYLIDDPNENKTRLFTMEEFVENIKSGRLGDDLEYKLGDLGEVYGAQWRNQNGVDQIKTCLSHLKMNPMGRYAIIDAWNPSDFDKMALPPCHLLYQFNCRELSDNERLSYVPEEVCVNGNLEDILRIYNTPRYYLDLQMYQRSCDTFLGVPFNIASMSLLLEIFAKYLNYIPGKIIWVGGDTHIYENHLEQVAEQLNRVPFELPKVKINKELNSIEDIEELTIDDFELINYQHHPSIKAELKTGL